MNAGPGMLPFIQEDNSVPRPHGTRVAAGAEALFLALLVQIPAWSAKPVA